MLNPNAPNPDPNTPTWLLIALAILYVLTAFNTWLHLIAKRTKNTYDDRAASYLDRAIAFLKRVSPLSALAVVALAGVAYTAVACGPKTAATLHAVEGCAASAAEDAVLPAVKSVLENGSPDSWQAEIEALAVAYGKDLIICTVADVGKLEAAKQGGDSAASLAASRARTYLAKLGYRP